LLLNIFLGGTTTIQPRRLRHFWACVRGGESQFGDIKWVQELFIANLGNFEADGLSASDAAPMLEVDPDTYYTTMVHDGRHLQVPSDLDDTICCYARLTSENRAKFGRAGFWMSMASRQW